MGFHFQTEVKAGYVRLTCEDTYSGKALLDAYESALDTAAREGLNAALLDIRALEGEPPDEMERFDLGMHAAKLQSKYDTRIWAAVVGNEPIVDPKRFVETVATNRGAYMKVFTDFDAAVAWLESKTRSTN